MTDHFKPCPECGGKHAKGLINCPKFSKPKALEAAKSAVKKIVSIPPMPSPETLAEIAEIAGVTIHANEPATADTPTDPTPPSWWRAGETPEFCPREPDKTPDERRRWMIEELRLTENGHRFYSSVADEMEAMIAEIEDLKKNDRRVYFRNAQAKVRAKKRDMK